MRIAIGSDHRGFAHKGALSARLRAAGHEPLDLGCGGPEACDYPEPAFAVGEAVAAGRCQFGVLVCGSGIGVSIAANKVRGVRAALCRGVDEARASRRHNDANVLCLSGDGTSPEQAWDIVQVWLATAFEGGRHARRVDLMTAYESARHEDGASAPPAPRGPRKEGQP